MRHVYIPLLFASTLNASAQLTNGSFELNGVFTLAGWEWTCDEPQPVMDAPNGGGLWCASVQPGHAKGCFPSYLYQRLPDAQNGDLYTLSGWVRCAEDDVNICMGAYLSLGSVNTGNFHLEETIGTSGTAWTLVAMEDTIETAPGDTAIVVLNSGFTGGPSSPLSGLFDEILVTGPEAVRTLNAPRLGLLYDDDGNTLMAAVADQTIRAIGLFDLTGRALPHAFRSTGGRTLSTSTADLPDGVYIVRARTGAGDCASRFVKH